MRALERFMLLQIIDERWREHLHDMDYLREGIHLRGFAQIDPLVAYKNEGFEMFTELMNNIWDEFARYIFNVEVEVRARAAAAGRRQLGDGRRHAPRSTGAYSYAGGHRPGDQPSALAGGGRGRRAVPGGRSPGRPASWPPTSRIEPPPGGRRRDGLDENERRSAATTRAGAARQEVQEVPWRLGQ